jgi:hypothetical protein
VYLFHVGELDPASEMKDLGDDDDVLAQMIGESVNQSIAESNEKAFAPLETGVKSISLESEGLPSVASRMPRDALPQAKIDFQAPVAPYGVPYGAPFPQGVPPPMHMFPPVMPMMYPGLVMPPAQGFPMPPMPPMPPQFSQEQQSGYPNQQQSHPASSAPNQGHLQSKSKPFPQLPRGQMMGPSDVRFVVSKALQGLEQVDAFNEDYYYIQVKQVTTAYLLRFYAFLRVFTLLIMHVVDVEKATTAARGTGGGFSCCPWKRLVVFPATSSYVDRHKIQNSGWLHRGSCMCLCM